MLPLGHPGDAPRLLWVPSVTAQCHRGRVSNRDGTLPLGRGGAGEVNRESDDGREERAERKGGRVERDHVTVEQERNNYIEKKVAHF